jgi:hypothetical protein
VAYKKNPDGDNVFAVFGTAVVIQDFFLDSVFIRNVYKNLPKIFIPWYVNNIINLKILKIKRLIY